MYLVVDRALNPPKRNSKVETTTCNSLNRNLITRDGGDGVLYFEVLTFGQRG